MSRGAQAPLLLSLLLVPVLATDLTSSSAITPHATLLPKTTSASPSARTATSSNDHSTEPPTSPSARTTLQPLRITVYFLSFHILNLPFNSSLEDPSTAYFKALQRNVSELYLQIYTQEGFLGSSNVKFSPGSVAVESTLAFRENTISASEVEAQWAAKEREVAAKYNLDVSRLSVAYPSSAQPGSGVPGWGIALLVLVCVLIVLAVIYLVALTVHQCRQKNCGQLDIFPTRDAYHPMSEYPTYHTHGRYVPPGSTKPNPYEVSAGNGGDSLSYTNLAATSANL
ncbi:mucin-1 [Pteropus medius]|uniref:mucin-1 n=1 Tax=Pteropus vampyrus TaxID=132908 RepID=UPI00196A6BEF|nr:mucin-1 [Pteropus giganteus]